MNCDIDNILAGHLLERICTHQKDQLYNSSSDIPDEMDELWDIADYLSKHFPESICGILDSPLQESSLEEFIDIIEYSDAAILNEQICQRVFEIFLRAKTSGLLEKSSLFVCESGNDRYAEAVFEKYLLGSFPRVDCEYLLCFPPRQADNIKKVLIDIVSDGDEVETFHALQALQELNNPQSNFWRDNWERRLPSIFPRYGVEDSIKAPILKYLHVFQRRDDK